jgi:hypothetical protein
MNYTIPQSQILYEAQIPHQIANDSGFHWHFNNNPQDTIIRYNARRGGKGKTIKRKGKTIKRNNKKKRTIKRKNNKKKRTYRKRNNKSRSK